MREHRGGRREGGGEGTSSRCEGDRGREGRVGVTGNDAAVADLNNYQ